jgi:DNA-binding response OmpR family regulator
MSRTHDAAPDRVDPDRIRPFPRLASAPDRPESRARPLILVVDDYRDTREMLAAYLTMRGYDVEMAEDAASALARMRARRPALVLLDLMMPGMPVETFRREQLLDPHLATVPIVCVSAAHDVRERARALGAIDCVRKPVEPSALLAIVERVCGPAGSPMGGSQPQ